MDTIIIAIKNIAIAIFLTWILNLYDGWTVFGVERDFVNIILTVDFFLIFDLSDDLFCDFIRWIKKMICE